MSDNAAAAAIVERIADYVRGLNVELRSAATLHRIEAEINVVQSRTAGVAVPLTEFSVVLKKHL